MILEPNIDVLRQLKLLFEQKLPPEIPMPTLYYYSRYGYWCLKSEYGHVYFTTLDKGFMDKSVQPYEKIDFNAEVDKMGEWSYAVHVAFPHHADTRLYPCNGAEIPEDILRLIDWDKRQFERYGM